MGWLGRALRPQEMLAVLRQSACTVSELGFGMGVHAAVKQAASSRTQVQVERLDRRRSNGDFVVSALRCLRLCFDAAGCSAKVLAMRCFSAMLLGQLCGKSVLPNINFAGGASTLKPPSLGRKSGRPG